MGRLVVAVLAIVVVGCDVSAAMARQSMSFTPGDRSRTHAHHIARPSAGRLRAKAHQRPTVHRHARRGGSSGDEGGEAAAKAVPGAGFKMQDGVLTYPAPARFQPGNLKRR